MKRSAFLLSLTFFCCLFFYQVKAQTIETVTSTRPHWISLDIVGINGMIEVPAGVELIRDNPGFHLGDGKGFYLQVIHTKERFGKITTAVENDKKRRFVKYVQDDFSGFIAEVKVKGKTEYDFYHFIHIGQEKYVLKDSEKLSHTDLKIIYEMYAAAKTIKAKYFIYN
ncbi:hypothetical protein [Ferruginibacter sp. HRS2-29]|uniref:hypothetical protein n=1 Tax=Ferruginibacter sp. HRS2-29 TaxID=2487334 RepID=UPI0020CD40D6|nr:hypothetical protein [Ferruginibacter sp. HRS2-29]MCP9750572.1 hypothetical protein [Ferruginibacter sp. HRS2-29]